MAEFVVTASAPSTLTLDLGSEPRTGRLAVVIYNPVAGSGPGKVRVELEAVRERFAAAGWRCGGIATQQAGDGTEAARLALASGADMVVAMGGDGTINEVVQALAGQSVPLGIIPTGTINILALELGLPMEPMAAVDALARGTPRTIDLGRANGRFFTIMIGIGYDAQATLNLLPELKAWTGPLAYWVAAFRSYTHHKAVRAKLLISDGRRTRRLRRLVYITVISNSGLYAGGRLQFYGDAPQPQAPWIFRQLRRLVGLGSESYSAVRELVPLAAGGTPDRAPPPPADVADGVLDAVVIRSGRWYRALFHGLLTFLGKLHTVGDVEFFRATRIEFHASRPIPYQLDGDHAGQSPVVVEIVPQALRVVVPSPGEG
ncbi:MAG: diacylglycerol kinase family protein [Candidatus Sericytochromatia bacterium]|nr:diacylglycerol kinase family protein [Candidatus Sericytochromatia bacterium]